MELDIKYFAELKSDEFFHVVRPLDKPIILISKTTGNPLVSIHLKTDHDTTIKKSNDHPYFEATINTHQKFSFVITNLTNHLVGIFIQSSSKIINKINLFLPYQSYELSNLSSRGRQKRIFNITVFPESKVYYGTGDTSFLHTYWATPDLIFLPVHHNDIKDKKIYEDSQIYRRDDINLLEIWGDNKCSIHINTLDAR